MNAVCPLVTKVHHELKVRAGKGYTVVYVGHAGHEEAIGTMAVDSPNFTRYGEVTQDEVFVTAKRAGEGVTFQNTGSEPFVSLRYFGPDTHSDLPNVGDHLKWKRG